MWASQKDESTSIKWLTMLKLISNCCAKLFVDYKLPSIATQWAKVANKILMLVSIRTYSSAIFLTARSLRVDANVLHVFLVVC